MDLLPHKEDTTSTSKANQVYQLEERPKKFQTRPIRYTLIFGEETGIMLPRVETMVGMDTIRKFVTCVEVDTSDRLNY